MKTILVIISVVLTWAGISVYDSITGTRAKSDDRSDTRTLRKQYDDLVLKNNGLNTTVKTDAETIKCLITGKESLNKELVLKIALINTYVENEKKSERALIASRELESKTKRKYLSLISKHNKLVARWNKKYKSSIKKSSINKAKNIQKQRNQSAIAELEKKKTGLKKSYSSYQKQYKYACQSVGGSPKSKARKAKKLNSLKSSMSTCSKSIKKVDREIARLKSR